MVRSPPTEELHCTQIASLCASTPSVYISCNGRLKAKSVAQKRYSATLNNNLLKLLGQLYIGKRWATSDESCQKQFKRAVLKASVHIDHERWAAEMSGGVAFCCLSSQLKLWAIALALLTSFLSVLGVPRRNSQNMSEQKIKFSSSDGKYWFLKCKEHHLCGMMGILITRKQRKETNCGQKLESFWAFQVRINSFSSSSTFITITVKVGSI